jgi:RHS repeat-associated protein
MLNLMQLFTTLSRRSTLLITTLLLSFLAVNAQTSYSPTSTSYTSVSGSTVGYSCGTSTNQIKFRLVSISGSTATFNVAKSATGNFSCNGTAYIKIDDVCGTVVGQSSYTGGTNGASNVNVTVSLSSISGFLNGTKSFYALTVSGSSTTCGGSRSHTSAFNITASTPSSLSSVNFTSSSTINFDCPLNFSWYSQNMQSNVKIEVIDGTSYVALSTIANSTSNSNGTNYYAYNNVQLAPFSQYRIRVSGYSSDGVYREGNSPYFTVTQGSINLNSPVGGQIYTLGGSNTMTIAWSSSNLSCTKYTAELWNANTNTYQTDLCKDVSSSPQYWSVAGVPAGTYKVKIYRSPTNGNANVIAWSGNFAIQAAQPALELNAPLSFGTTTMTANQTYTFTTNIKNQGGANWQGSWYLVINNQVIDLGSHPVIAGQSVVITKSIIPTSLMVGTNVSVNLRYQTNGGGQSISVSQGPFHTNPTTVTINQAQAFDLKMNAAMAISPATPVQGQSANFSGVVKNAGNLNFTGSIALQLLNSNKVLLTDLNRMDNVTIAPNGTLNLPFSTNAITSAAGSYYLNVVYYTAATGWKKVEPNTFQNPQLLRIVQPQGPCDITMPPPERTESNAAATYLCNQGIITPNAGDVRPDDYIIRQDLAKVMFVALFGNINTVTVADNFPTPFGDLQVATEPYYRYMKILSYLEYGDGLSPFNRRFYYANPTNQIVRKDLCKVICETWNLSLVRYANNQYFDDLIDLTADEVAYINTCAQKGIITTGIRTFKPTDKATRDHAFIMVHRLLTSAAALCPKPTNVATTEGSFFLPGNYTPDNLGNHPSLSDTNFDQYSQVSFSIADRQLPLVFEHNYNSYLTEIPDELIGRKPLGEGWSHSYNGFIFKLDGYTNPETGKTYPKVWAIFWPNGTIHLYNVADNKSINKGNYDELSVTNVGTDTTFVIKKKNQVLFTFKREAAAANTEPFLLTSIKDRNNNTIQINYLPTSGNKFRLSSVVAPSGRALSFGYTGTDDKISTVTDPLGRVVRFYYGGPEGTDLMRYFDADGKETTYNYGQTAAKAHLLERITLPNGNFIDNSYTRRKLNLTKTVNSSTNTVVSQTAVTNFAHSQTGTNSNVEVVTGGNTASYGYSMDKLGNVKGLTASTYSVGATYDDPSFPMKPTTMTLNGVQAVYTYDPKGNVWTSTLPDPNGGSIVHEFTYNSFNDPLTYKNPRGYTTTFEYYPTVGNLKKITNPIGFTQFGVNSFGQVETITNPENIVVTYGYNDYGNINSVTAPLSITSKMHYDAASRVWKSFNPLEKQTLFGYDNRDNLTSTTDALNNTTQFRFDDNSNLKKIINAKGGETVLEYNYFDWLISEQFGASIKGYDYDNEGKLKKFTKPDGTAINYTYNVATQLLETDGYTNFTYDSPRNRLKTVTYQGKVLTFNYDNLDRITSTVYDGNTIAYTYDKNNNVTTITYPGSKVVTYTFDEIDRLKTVTDWNNQKTEYFYKKDSRLDYVTLPNGVITTYAYDVAGRMTGYNTKKAAAVICQYTFNLDKLGNHTLESKQEPISTYATLTQATHKGEYDNQNRLITYNNKNFTFDANGRTRVKTGRTYEWDVYDRLTSVSGDFTASYEYDGLGNRRKATRNGITTKFALDILGMSQVLMETDNANTPQYYYVYGLGLISRIKPDNTTRYYHGDFRGSVVAMTDAAGTVTHKYQYDEFGTILQKTEQDDNRFCYVGMAGVQYEETNLIFMRARYYDPEIGRFLSEDPVWSANLYTYSNNNPINQHDPTGKQGYIIDPEPDSWALVESADKVGPGLAIVLFGIDKISLSAAELAAMLSGLPPGEGTIIYETAKHITGFLVDRTIDVVLNVYEANVNANAEKKYLSPKAQEYVKTEREKKRKAFVEKNTANVFAGSVAPMPNSLGGITETASPVYVPQSSYYGGGYNNMTIQTITMPQQTTMSSYTPPTCTPFQRSLFRCK